MSLPESDYRHLRQRYAPRVRVCRQCDSHLNPAWTLAWHELLCPACLHKRGLQAQAEAAQRRLMTLLRRRAHALGQRDSSHP